LSIRNGEYFNDKYLMEESEFGVYLEKLLEKSGVSITQLAKERGVRNATL